MNSAEGVALAIIWAACCTGLIFRSAEAWRQGKQRLAWTRLSFALALVAAGMAYILLRAIR